MSFNKKKQIEYLHFLEGCWKDCMLEINIFWVKFLLLLISVCCGYCDLTLISFSYFIGKPVTGYVVEKLNKATGRWVPVGKTDDTEMEIKGLQEGEEYEFRVKAVNDEGESEPLKTDHSIIAKNPYGKFFYCIS